MADYHQLPDGHVLKPLELRLLEMADDQKYPMSVFMGNAVAALRVFAAEHPNLRDCVNDERQHEVQT